MLEVGDTLSRDKLAQILEMGHSRWPIYQGDKHNVRGFIRVKQLILMSPNDSNKVEDMTLQEMVLVPPTIGMLDLLNKFQVDRCHIALVTDAPETVREAWRNKMTIPPDVHMMGILTMEDIIEKLIQEDIYDEDDGGLPVSSSKRILQPMLQDRSSSSRFLRSETPP